MRYISLVTTIMYGAVAVLLSTIPTILNDSWLAWVSEWWGVVTGAYLMLQALPIAWILLFRENTKEAWKWSLEHADTASSYILITIIVVGVPAINGLIPGDMLHWQFKLWLVAAFAAGAELLLALIEDQCQRNAPAGHAPAAHPSAGGAAHH